MERAFHRRGHSTQQGAAAQGSSGQIRAGCPHRKRYSVEVQQSRWEGGRQEVIASLFPRTVRALASRPSIALLDGLFDMLVPPISVVVALNAVGILASLLTGSGALPVFAASLLVFLGAVLAGLLRNNASAGVYQRLVCAPVFIVWKLFLLAKLRLAPAATAWVRTPRDRSRE
jgi:hypothetical protein